MSFFDMLAGGVGGLGTGMAQVGQMDMQERLRNEQLASMMARTAMQDDSREKIAQMRGDFATQIAEMKAANGTGGKGAGPGMSFIDKLILEADTPEKQLNAVRYAKMRAGDDAAARVAEFFGKPMQQTSEQFDPAAAEALSRRDYAQAHPEVGTGKTVTSNVVTGSKGLAELNRMLAMADPKGYESFIKGERGATLKDSANVAGAGVKDPVERATLEQSLSNPGSTTQAALDSKDYGADQRLAGAEFAANAKLHAKAAVAGQKPERIATILNSANATIKSLNDAGKGKTPEARAQWDIDMAAAQALRREAMLAQQGDVTARISSGATPVAPPSNPSAATNRPPLSSFNKK